MRERVLARACSCPAPRVVVVHTSSGAGTSVVGAIGPGGTHHPATSGPRMVITDVHLDEPERRTNEAEGVSLDGRPADTRRPGRRARQGGDRARARPAPRHESIHRRGPVHRLGRDRPQGDAQRGAVGGVGLHHPHGGLGPGRLVRRRVGRPDRDPRRCGTERPRVPASRCERRPQRPGGPAPPAPVRRRRQRHRRAGGLPAGITRSPRGRARRGGRPRGGCRRPRRSPRDHALGVGHRVLGVGRRDRASSPGPRPSSGSTAWSRPTMPPTSRPISR